MWNPITQIDRIAARYLIYHLIYDLIYYLPEVRRRIRGMA